MSIVTRLLVSAPLVAGSLVMAACEISYPPRAPTHATAINAYPIVATMRGTMGAIDGIASDDADVALTGSASTTVVRIDAEDRRAGKWAMARFTIRGGLDQAALRPGARFSFDAPAPSTSTTPRTPATGVISAALGCSGPERDRYTYDQSPRHVDMSVERGSTPTALRLVYSATFVNTSGANQTLTGTFEYEPR